ncbi:MAG: EAL domain-containing protein [Mycobacteriales bacterium]
MTAATERMTSLDALLDVARNQLGMEVAFIAEFTQGQRVMRHVSANRPTILEPGATEPLEGTLCQLIVDGKLPQVIPDAAANPVSAALPVVQAAGIGAYVGVPVIFRDGRLYGTLCTLQSTPDPSLTTRDASVLSVIAKAVSELLEDDHARQAVRTEMQERIDALVAGGGPAIVYQPIFDVSDGSIAGFEALSRFPANSGLTTEQWYVRAAAIDAEPALELAAVRAATAILDDAGALDGYLSINLSARTICTPAAAQLLAKLPLEQVVVELTEHAQISDYGALVAALRPLREAGLRLAVDDAGAGFASLQHILRLAADFIKLDRSLVAGIQTDPARQALARALLRFAGDTNSLVVAEGVETEDELAALKALGVRYVQGYLLGRPAPWLQLREASGL